MTQSQEVNQGQRAVERDGNKLCAQGSQTERGVDSVQCCIITVGLVCCAVFIQIRNMKGLCSSTLQKRLIPKWDVHHLIEMT